MKESLRNETLEELEAYTTPGVAIDWAAKIAANAPRSIARTSTRHKLWVLFKSIGNAALDDFIEFVIAYLEDALKKRKA